MTRKKSSGIVSALEQRFADFENSTGSVLTQSGVGVHDQSDLTEDDIGAMPSRNDPRVAAAFMGDGFYVTKSL